MSNLAVMPVATRYYQLSEEGYSWTEAQRTHIFLCCSTQRNLTEGACSMNVE